MSNQDMQIKLNEITNERDGLVIERDKLKQTVNEKT
jgi:hypothetical protein